jgi:MFS family permease
VLQATTAGGAAFDNRASPPARIGWTTVLILFVFYVFAMVDRQVMAMLVDPIRHDLNISDVKVSLLLGLSFAIFFSTIGLFMGYLVDRISRRTLIAVSVALWGISCAACGLAGSFGELFLARMLVGVGEAALGPAAYSMLSDSFPPHRMSLAMSIYSAGGLVGGAIAILGGGVIVEFSRSHGQIVLPMVGALSSWRLVFFLTGLPGPLLALLAFLVPEPARTGRLAAAPGPPSAGVGSFIREHWKLLVLLCLGYGGLNMIINNVFAWSPTFMKRSLGMAPVDVGLTIAALLLFCAVPGQTVIGWWTDRQAAHGRSDSYLRYFVLFVPLAVPTAVAGLLGGSPLWFALGTAPLFFVAMPFMGAAAAALQRITPNEYRGRITALFLMITMLIGIGAGPTLVALISTALDPAGKAMGDALAIVVTASAAVAVACLAAASPLYRRTLASS